MKVHTYNKMSVTVGVQARIIMVNYTEYTYLPSKTRELVVIKILRDNSARKQIGVLDDKHVTFRSPVSS